MSSAQPLRFFVYGTLRPDIKAPWSDSVYGNPDFDLKYYKAVLPHAKLFVDEEGKFPVTLQDFEKYSEEDLVIGYLIESKINNEKFLAFIDEIEEYPELYIRKEVAVKTEETVYQKVILYTRPQAKLIDIGYSDYKIYLEENNLVGKIDYN